MGVSMQGSALVAVHSSLGIMHTVSFHRFGPRAVACGVLLLCACHDPHLEGVELDPQGGDGGGDGIALTVNHDVDVLFVVDDTSSMDAEQAKLAAAFEAFLEVLERPEVRANYRIAFTTTDDGNPACQGTTPELGALRLESCRSRPEAFGEGQACASSCPEGVTEIETLPTTIDDGTAQAKPRPWIESSEGRTNLPEGLSPLQALQCASPQGLDGCGFESPLESMWKALERVLTQDDPAYGFVRSHSILSVVHVTDGTDCSLNPQWEAIFLPDANRVFWSDPEAEAPTTAVCWNAGVACEGTSPYEGCHSIDLDIEGYELSDRDADERAVLYPLDRYVDQVQELENNKQIITPEQQVILSIIAGVASDGSVTYADAVDPQLQLDFGIGPGCDGADGPAMPPVRLLELADAFQVGDRPNVFSACDDDYSPALVAIAEGIAEEIRPACVPACVADEDPETDELDPGCTITQESPRGDGSFEEIILPECEANRAVPEGYDTCYVPLVGDARSELCTDVGFNLELEFVHREGKPFPGGTAVKTDCKLSKDKETDCPELP